MRILVLGSTGLLGKDICKAFDSPDFRVMTPCRTMLAGWYGILTDAWYVDLDFAEKYDRIKQLFDDLNPEMVINCIAYTNVEKAETCVEEARVVNAEFPSLLAQICQERGAGLVHISTDYVFGGLEKDKNQKKKFTEEDICSPTNIYSTTKRMGEVGVLEYQTDKTWIVRTCWLFGSGKKNWLDLGLAQDGKYFDLYRLTFGSPTYTLDLAEGIKRIVTTKPRAGIYHVANDTTEPVTKLEMMHFARFQAGTNKPMEEKIAVVTAPRPLNTALGIEKFNAVYEMPNIHNAIDRYLKEIGKYAR